MLNFFSDAPKVPLLSELCPLPNTKKLFLWLSEWDDWLSWKLKNKTFLAKSLPKFHMPVHEMVFHNRYTYNFLSLAFTKLATPNKQFFNVKFLKGILDQLSKS